MIDLRDEVYETPNIVIISNNEEKIVKAIIEMILLLCPGVNDLKMYPIIQNQLREDKRNVREVNIRISDKITVCFDVMEYTETKRAMYPYPMFTLVDSDMELTDHQKYDHIAPDCRSFIWSLTEKNCKTKGYFLI